MFLISFIGYWTWTYFIDTPSTSRLQMPPINCPIMKAIGTDIFNYPIGESLEAETNLANEVKRFQSDEEGRHKMIS